MTIWYVHNRPDEPITVPTSEAATSTKTKTKTTIPQITKQRIITTKNKLSSTTKWTTLSLFVRWQRMNVISFGLSGCWHWILYGIIIINVITQKPSMANAGTSKLYATPDASTRPASFFETDRIQCPSFVENSACPCYKFEDGKSNFCNSTFVCSFDILHFVITKSKRSIHHLHLKRIMYAFFIISSTVSLIQFICFMWKFMGRGAFSLVGNHAIIGIMNTNIINSPKK